MDIKPEDILASYKSVLASVAAISLEAGIPTQASAPHSIMNAFKNLVAVTFESEYTFDQATAMKTASVAAPVAGDAKVEEKAEEKEEEKVAEDVDGPGDIFGGEDEY